MAAFGNPRHTGRVRWDHRSCADQLRMEPSSNHIMGRSCCANNSDTGPMSRAGFLLRRDSSFLFTTAAFGCHHQRYRLRYSMRGLRVGNVRNLDLLLLPIFPADPRQWAYAYLRVLCPSSDLWCACFHYNGSSSSSSAPSLGHDVVPHVIHHCTNTRCNGTCPADILVSDIRKHDIHHLGYRYELSRRYNYLEQCGEAGTSGHRSQSDHDVSPKTQVLSPRQPSANFELLAW